MRPQALKLLGASLLMLVGVLCLSTARFAAYSGDGGVTVAPTSVHTGGAVKIESTGWKPSSSITITLHSTPVVLSTVNSDDSGAVERDGNDSFGHRTGAHHRSHRRWYRRLSSHCEHTDHRHGCRRRRGSLPRTGAAIAALAFVGLALFAGGSLMSAARRRATR